MRFALNCFPSDRLTSRFGSVVVLLGSITIASGADQAANENRVDFNEQIKPILSDRCFFCHGPDAENRQAD